MIENQTDKQIGKWVGRQISLNQLENLTVMIFMIYDL